MVFLKSTFPQTRQYNFIPGNNKQSVDGLMCEMTLEELFDRLCETRVVHSGLIT